MLAIEFTFKCETQFPFRFETPTPWSIWKITKSKLNCLWKYLIEIAITVYIYESPRGSHGQKSRSNQSIGRRALAAFSKNVYERL